MFNFILKAASKKIPFQQLAIETNDILVSLQFPPNSDLSSGPLFTAAFLRILHNRYAHHDQYPQGPKLG